MKTDTNTYPLLAAIGTPADLRKLNAEQLPEVCEELRRDILEEVSHNPGHMASNRNVLMTCSRTRPNSFIQDTVQSTTFWWIWLRYWVPIASLTTSLKHCKDTQPSNQNNRLCFNSIPNSRRISSHRLRNRQRDDRIFPAPYQVHWAWCRSKEDSENRLGEYLPYSPQTSLRLLCHCGDICVSSLLPFRLLWFGRVFLPACYDLPYQRSIQCQGRLHIYSLHLHLLCSSKGVMASSFRAEPVTRLGKLTFV